MYTHTLLRIRRLTHVPGFVSESSGVSKSYGYWARTSPAFVIAGTLLAVGVLLFNAALNVTSALEAISFLTVVPVVILALMWLQVSKNRNVRVPFPPLPAPALAVYCVCGMRCGCCKCNCAVWCSGCPCSSVRVTLCVPVCVCV